MASDGVLLGEFGDLSGEVFEVRVKPSGTVLLRGDQGGRVLLGPSGRDELRELLDRAAMPGQPGATAPGQADG